MVFYVPFHRSVSIIISCQSNGVDRRVLEGVCLLVLTLLLLLSWDPANFNWDPANLFLSPHSHPPPPPGPAFFSQESVDARKVENFSERMASRQARIREVCRRHNASLSWDEKRREGSMKRHIWDVVNHLVFCPIAKVASTTWFLNFLAWSKIERTSVPLVLDQLKEAGGRKGNGEINWKGEAGGRGVRTLARCQNLSLFPPNSDLTCLCTGTSSRLQRPLASKT